MRLLVLQSTLDDSDTTPLNWRKVQVEAMGLRADMSTSELRSILRWSGFLLIRDALVENGATRMLTVIHKDDDCRDPGRVAPLHELGGEA